MILPLQLTTFKLQCRKTPFCQKSFSTSVEAGLTTKRVEQTCPLFSRGELNSLCRMDAYSGDPCDSPFSTLQGCSQGVARSPPRHDTNEGPARMFVWWPGIDGDIERTVWLCRECQTSLSSPPLAPLQPWKWPTRPWSRLHIDYAGPMYGKMCLIIVDAHSKWIEAAFVPSATSAATIELLCNSFACFGLPSSVVTDNAPYFVSEEIELFFKQNGIHHLISLPYHPASNGLVEHTIQTIKKGLRKVTEGTLNTRLSKVLFTYWITPHATMDVSPTELLLHYQPRTRLSLLFPQIADCVENQQSRQKKLHDRTAQQHNFTQGQAVHARNFREGGDGYLGILWKLRVQYLTT